jgi:hypothetical protein
MRGIRLVECVTSDSIVRPTSAPTLRFPDAVASPKGKMPILIGLSPVDGGDVALCPAVRLATASMMRIRTLRQRRLSPRIDTVMIGYS